MRRAASRRQRFHLRVKIGFSLEADARQIRHGDVTVLDANAIREAAIGLEQVGIALIATETETGRAIERHLMPAMRDAAARRPSLTMQHPQLPALFARSASPRAIQM